MAVFIDFEVSEISNFRKSTSEGTQNVCHEATKANSINTPVLVFFQKKSLHRKNCIECAPILQFFFVCLYNTILADFGSRQLNVA